VWRGPAALIDIEFSEGSGSIFLIVEVMTAAEHLLMDSRFPKERCPMTLSWPNKGLVFLLLSFATACGASSAGSTDGAASPGGTGSDSGSASGDSGSPGKLADATVSTTHPAHLPVNLGVAASFVMLAKSGISVVPTAAVTGDLGVSPAAATLITGLSLTADPTNVFATSPQVVGRIYAADDAPPTPARMTTAIGDMERAFTDAAGRPSDVTELGAGNIGGMTIAPGVYKWGTGLLLPTDVTLAGDANAVWIFQIAQDLTVSSAVKVLLTGGGSPANVFWQVAGSVDLGTTAHLEGVVLAQTSITLRTGASIKGRLLSQTAIAIDGSTVVPPSP
jgi:hypothetical protein